MSKNSSEKKAARVKSRSWVKPAIVTVVLMVVALGVAAFMVRRNGAASSSSGSGGPTGPSGGNFKPVVISKGWTQGNTAAKSILVEFGDYQCGACAAAR